MLRGIRTATDLKTALRIRPHLGEGESVVTPDGIWMGGNWLRINKDKDAEAGVLKRQQELETFQSSIRNAEQTVEKLSVELDSG